MHVYLLLSLMLHNNKFSTEELTSLWRQDRKISWIVKFKAECCESKNVDDSLGYVTEISPCISIIVWVIPYCWDIGSRYMSARPDKVTCYLHHWDNEISEGKAEFPCIIMICIKIYLHSQVSNHEGPTHSKPWDKNKVSIFIHTSFSLSLFLSISNSII